MHQRKNMTIRKRPKFSDTPSGRLKSIYQEVFAGPAKEIDASLSERLYSIARPKQAVAGHYNWLRLLLMMPLFIIYDFLRVWGFAIVAAGFRYLPPKLKTISTQLSFDPAFYDKHPAKQVIRPNRLYSGSQEIGVSDGEHLWVENAHSANRPIAGIFIFGLSIPLLIPVIFEPLNFILGLLLHPLSPLVTLPLLFASLFSFSFLPVKTGIMFHRRAQTATFYRGWLLSPVTVPFEQVTYTAGIDPRGTGGWLVIRARVPSDVSFTGWVKLSTAISDQKAMAAGAIDVFMDLDNDFAMPRRIKESIEWHQETKTTLWRYVKSSAPQREIEKYEEPDSLYQKIFCDTFESFYKKAMNPDTIETAREEFIKDYKFGQELKKSAHHRNDFIAHMDMISDYLVSLIEGKEPNIPSEDFYKIESKFIDEINLGLASKLSPFHTNLHSELHKLINSEKCSERRSKLLSLSRKINIRNRDSNGRTRLTSKSIEKLLDIFPLLNEAYKDDLLEENWLREAISKIKDNDIYPYRLLDNYDWENFEKRAMRIVFSL